jgi:hypothetical protein
MVLDPRLPRRCWQRKHGGARSLDELLFAMIVLGDDRLVQRTVSIAGAPG